MQCPNCGRDIRSKNQCAYCGHVFTNEEAKELEREDKVVNQPASDDYYTPPTKSKAGIGSMILGVLKLVIAITVLFMLFAYGPTAYRFVSQKLGFGGAPAEEKPLISKVDEPNSQENEHEAAEEAADVKLVNHTVSLDNYPTVELKLEFNEALTDVTSDTFNFTVRGGDNETKVEQYSLTKDGQTLSLSFNDPMLSVVSTEAVDHVLVIDAPSLSVHEEVSYQVPQEEGNKELSQKFNDIVTSALGGAGDTAVVMSGTDTKVPLVYNDHSVEAGNLMSWFITQRIYQAYEEKALTPETEVAISDELKADNDEGQVAQKAKGETITVGELVDHMLKDRDASAMNHLIQEVGGPNEFNLWLNQSNYFGTKITQKLALNDNGVIVGANTTGQDITHLLDLLASKKLVSSEQSEEMMKKYLEIPANEKFASDGIEEVTRYYELSTSDTNAEQQYFSGVFEMGDKFYTVVILVNNPKDIDETVTHIKETLIDLLHTAEGKDLAERSSSHGESSSDSQVSIVEPEPAPAPAPAPEPAAPQYVEPVAPAAPQYQYGADLDANGNPTTVYDPASGQYNSIHWYQGADGQWYWTR